MYFFNKWMNKLFSDENKILEHFVFVCLRSVCLFSLFRHKKTVSEELCLLIKTLKLHIAPLNVS